MKLTKDDGWNEAELQELIEWLDDVERVHYEIKNARRGVYAEFGDTDEDLIAKLEEMKENLGFVIEELSYKVEKGADA